MGKRILSRSRSCGPVPAFHFEMAELRWFAVSLLLAVWIFCGCSGEGADPSLLAKVGDVRITVSDLHNLEGKLAAREKSENQGEEDHGVNLQTLVDREVLIAEARARGLDEDDMVLERLKANEVKRLAEEMMRRQVLERVVTSDEEIAQFYTERGWDEQVVTMQIFVPDAEKAAQAMQRLRAGEEFYDVAPGYAVDPLFKVPIDAPKQFVYFAFDAPQEVVKEVFSAAEGEVVGPVPFRDGFIIAQVEKRRQVALEEVKEGIKEALLKEKRRLLRQAYLRHLKEDLEFTIQPEGMQLSVEVLSRELPLDSLSDEQRRLPVYTYGDGSFSVGEVVAQLRSMRRRWAEVNQDTINVVLANGALPLYVMATDARRNEVDRSPEFLEWQRSEREDLMISRLRKMILDERLEMSEQDLEAFYEENKNRFRMPARARIQELLVEEPELTRKLADQLAQGADMAGLIREHGIRQNVEDGLMWVHASQKILYGDAWMDAVMNAPLNEIRGPVQSKGGYSIFKVLEREPESFLPLADKRVRQSVERDVVRLKSLAIFEQYIEELRRKYADRIEIYEKNLEQLSRKKELETDLS